MRVFSSSSLLALGDVGKFSLVLSSDLTVVKATLASISPRFKLMFNNGQRIIRRR